VVFGARLAALALLLSCGAAARAAAAEGPALEVEVKGEPAARSGKRDPSGASQVVRDERLRAPGASAADVLAQIPGVQVARAGAESDLATASIRGATSAETPVYFAGVRVNDDTTGAADLSLLPLWMIQRVEVYRSGAPFDADRLGPGGAIFFEPVLPKSPRVGAGLGAGSFGELSTWVAGAAGDERAAATVAFRRRSATNDYPYVDGGGAHTRTNADFASYDLLSTARVQVGRASIRTVASALSREQGVAGLSVIPARAARARVSRMLAAATVSSPCAAGDRCALELQTSVLLSKSEVRDPLHEIGLVLPFAASAGARLVESARLRYHVTDRIVLLGSLSQEIEQLRIDEPRDALLRARRAATRPAVSAVVDVTPALQLNALAALEYHATQATGEGAHTSAAEPTARAGARLRIAEGVDLLANAGRYARVPTLGELYGTSAVVRGNADLAPERGYLADAGARLSFSRPSVELYADVFGFARFASDLIAFRVSGLHFVRPYNVASARVLGVEVAGGAKLWSHARAELALTVLDPRDTSAGRTTANDLLPFRSRLVATPSIELYAGPWPALALERASVTARVAYSTAHNADPAALVTIPAQASLDLELSLSFWKGRLAARVAVTDVFDANRYDLVNLPLPRRSGHGSLEAWW
jgi:iron complex outermembrane receptor protein